jgi:hypothetical protein
VALTPDTKLLSCRGPPGSGAGGGALNPAAVPLRR